MSIPFLKWKILFAFILVINISTLKCSFPLILYARFSFSSSSFFVALIKLFYSTMLYYCGIFMYWGSISLSRCVHCIFDELTALTFLVNEMKNRSKKRKCVFQIKVNYTNTLAVREVGMERKKVYFSFRSRRCKSHFLCSNKNMQFIK